MNSPSLVTSRIAFGGALVVCWANALGACGDRAEPAAAGHERAPFPSPAWEERSPEQQGMDQASLDAALDYAFQEGKHTQGVVVVRGRAIVAERYAPDRGADDFAASWSVGKSIASAAVGIAIEQGFIDDVDIPLSDYYPAWRDTPKATIRLRHVLNMASGLTWQESYDPSNAASSDVIQMVFSQDALTYATSLSTAHEPGTSFNYSSGDTMLVSGVIEQATGMSAGDFAERELFSRIAMTPVHWWRDLAGNTLTYCCVDTPTREFAKFGLLYLERGNWNGTQVITEAWVDSSIQPSPAFEGYGYFWWLIGRTTEGIPEDTYAARGVDGQYIYVIPSLDLVVVRNGRYDKHPGEAVADPNLFAVYPSRGLSADQGTVPPDTWSDVDFLSPIVAAVMDP